MKIKLLFIVSLIIVISCYQKSNSEKTNLYLYDSKMPSDFEFSINNGAVDTYNSNFMIFSREFTDSIYKIKIPINPVEKKLIYKKYKGIDFQSFPTKFEYVEGSIVEMRMPSFTTSITIIEKNKSKRILFDLGDLKNELVEKDKAIKYKEFYNFIWNIIKNKKEYKTIPKSDIQFM
jgi:hypothetical protein